MTKHDEITGLRQELKDLKVAIVRRECAAEPGYLGIAQAKIAKLRRHIKELEEALAHAG